MNISHTIINWYQKNKRDLPWRSNTAPYRVWLSEIILQQTRVAQGEKYFHKFISQFPDIESLAAASEDTVLKLWQGLGYYSRARNLHFTAKYIVQHYNGRFPSTYPEIRALKGVGHYTAAAIASFAFKLPYPAIDGNVMRILARLFCIETPIYSANGKKQIQQIANQLIENQPPDIFNQALMEFGSLQCVPKSPDCPNCPLRENCMALAKGKVAELPVRNRTLKQTKRFFHYLVVRNGSFTFLNQRTQNDIWKNLYEFPLLETPNESPPETLMKSEAWKKHFPKESFTLEKISETFVHQLSHRRIFARFYVLNLKPESLSADFFEKNYLKIPKNELHSYAVSRLIEKFLESE